MTIPLTSQVDLNKNEQFINDGKFKQEKYLS